MQKIEYGDINKFLVSIGLVLISLAILTPYLYLKEDFGLYIEKEKFEKLQQPIQELITDKQEQVRRLQSLISWLPFTLFGLGILTLGFGLYRWSKRQVKIDEKFDDESEKLKIEIRNLTGEEKRETVITDIHEIEVSKKIHDEITDDVFKIYLNIEKRVFERFQQYKSPNFRAISDVKMDNKYAIDILLQANSSKYADRIVEIKYFSDYFQSAILKSAINRLISVVNYYKNYADSKVVPVLIIVYKQEKMSVIDIKKYKTQISNYSKSTPTLQRLKVEFIEENEIESFEVKKLLQK